MKCIAPLLSKFLILALLPLCVSCETTAGGRKKKKVVTAEQFDAAQGHSVSGLPWNRQRSFESGGGMGRMMPQSR